jgi:hypothetical protein
MNPKKLAQIKKRISDMYMGIDEGRNLIVTQIHNHYGRVGSILFSLEGSPPKGYALYVPGHRKIIFIDAWLGKTHKISDYSLEDVEK